MRGGPLQALIHLAMYPVVLSLLVPMASAAYASTNVTVSLRRRRRLWS